LSRDGHDRRVKGNFGKCVINFLLQELKRRIDTSRSMNIFVLRSIIMDTYIDSTLSLRSATVGRLAFNLVRLSSKEEGSVRFVNPSRLGTVIWGAWMSLKGLILLTVSIKSLITLFAEAISF